ncbi:hypothetical protein SAMN04488561_4025 [Jiangella alba]|uniref:Uncharacterized protein n=1 Tax=Jiangella alba TaxID=561176 RepID=A0A1H5PB06_9ACTN|nr:hypothetical protein SAMN04488561_4025 [Jiangella alba]
MLIPARIRFKVHGVFLPHDVSEYGDLGNAFWL